MGVTAVIGLQWGDEGKGKVVDVLCERADVVVRCQGGSNAGHTVVVDRRAFVLHLVPSGILRQGTTCLIGNGVAVDLELLDKEIRELEAAGINTAGRLVLSKRAHVVLPFHKQIDRADEESRGSNRIGTTMRGIGPCYSDKYARLGVRVGDILNPSTLGARLEAASGVYSARAGEGPRFDVEESREHCRTYLPMVKEISGDVTPILEEAHAGGKRILLEGAQGFLLDIDHGTYPYVTSSNTGVHGLALGAGLPPSSIDRVVGVLKAYVTRVGEGPMPTEMEEPYQTQIREKGREFGATTGRPRRCGWPDLVALKYSCSVNGVTSIAATKMDTLSGLDTLKLCVAYEYSGSALPSFPSETDLLAACVPRYLPGETWNDLRDVKSVGDLPPGARRYLDRITGVGGCRLEMVSVGPGRDDVIEVQD